ncbi:MAG: AEC family transporter, partial [Oscillospiraceae bacterium]|nr:AEC family transporter [Oscillospiraceae bacterium]
FVGAPIAEAIYGGPGIILSSCYQLPYCISMWSVGLAYYAGAFDKKNALKKVATHPCVLSVAIGFLVSYFKVSLPGVIENSIGALGACSAPISMLLTGMILAGANTKSILNPRTVYHTVMRIIVLPAAVLGFSWLFGLRGLALSINVLMAALPAGIVSVMLASKYRADEVFASSCVVLSTALSFVTIPMWQLILQRLAG